MRDNTKDREFDKFRSATGGLSKIAVTIEQDSAIPIEFAESIAQQILKASDRQKQFTWLDFSTRNERVSTIIYTAASVGAYVLTKTFSYSLSGNAYRLDSESLVLTGA
jgi:hypothetical protein